MFEFCHSSPKDPSEKCSLRITENQQRFVKTIQFHLFIEFLSSKDHFPSPTLQMHFCIFFLPKQMLLTVKVCLFKCYDLISPHPLLPINNWESIQFRVSKQFSPAKYLRFTEDLSFSYWGFFYRKSYIYSTVKLGTKVRKLPWRIHRSNLVLLLALITQFHSISFCKWQAVIALIS